ncbi:hypothetical protein HMPREF0872_03950 [Veillonella montpellierensis DNF00314]|uniref:Uncharacterized protein n=1 Tax=Veillonella montpellierensis DNF00314 TaxID=1401067 RepID=A0A096CQE0_9FIRM|nr:hypothetical protein [Veillonella montpellierensis]KGF47559.1 hypothetical protein HMPREF0872_03950 [Veillonella montpellierensis DNF00314]
MDKKELRKEILQLMYDKGYRYIAKNENGNVHVYKTLPEKKCSYWTNGDLFARLHFTDNLFEDVKFEDKEPLSIAEELGIVDWSTIPKDTKVLVSDDGEHWFREYFRRYEEHKEKPFIVYAGGRTSWSVAYGGLFAEYKYCKLAEEI